MNPASSCRLPICMTAPRPATTAPEPPATCTYTCTRRRRRRCRRRHRAAHRRPSLPSLSSSVEDGAVIIFLANCFLFLPLPLSRSRSAIIAVVHGLERDRRAAAAGEEGRIDVFFHTHDVFFIHGLSILWANARFDARPLGCFGLRDHVSGVQRPYRQLQGGTIKIRPYSRLMLQLSGPRFGATLLGRAPSQL